MSWVKEDLGEESRAPFGSRVPLLVTVLSFGAGACSALDRKLQGMLVLQRGPLAGACA